MTKGPEATAACERPRRAPRVVLAALAVGWTAYAAAATSEGQTASARGFVAGRTEVENVRPIGRELDNLDIRGLLVRRAPEVIGRIEFDVQPETVAPHQPYRVKVFLTNEGKKDIRLDEVGLITFHDEERVTRSVKPRSGRARPNQRILLTEIEARGADTFWAVEVTAISKRKDVYRNKLVWK